MDQFREIPQVDIPDEFTQVDRPEVEITTPHPADPANPQAVASTSGGGMASKENQAKEQIGFTQK